MLLVSDDASYASEIQIALGGVSEGANLRVIYDEEAALDLIQGENIELVFARLGAGPMASTFFLNEVWKRNPKTTRFMIDTRPDSEAMVRCILGGHYFLEMPLTPETIQIALERAAATRDFLRNERIQSLISRIRTLPPRPSIYMEVLREVRSPRASATVVGELVAKDLAVATKLIQVVNTPYYGVAEPITDVKEAVLYLGLDTTVSIVCSIETFARFDKIKPLYFSVDRVWKHSQLVADLARRISLLMGASRERAAEAFLAGLLHDVGELALAENFGSEYDAALKDGEKKGRRSWMTELDVFGATHADAGAYLLTLWGLSLPVVEAVANHHSAQGALGASFSPGVALHLAEQFLEQPEELNEIVARYPPEIGLRERIQEIGALLPNSGRKTQAVPAEGDPQAVASKHPEAQSPAPLAPGRNQFAKLFPWRHPTATAVALEPRTLR